MLDEHSEHNSLSREEINALKEELIAGDYLAFQARCVKAFSSADAGIFLRQLVYWTGKGREDGWFWKTAAEMDAETGLGERQQRRARKILNAKGVIEEARRGVPCRMHYRVNLERLAEILGVATPRESQDEIPDDWFDDLLTDGDGGPGLNHSYSVDANTAGTSPDGITGGSSSEGNSAATIQETTAESTARDYPSEDPPLQGGGDGSSSRTPPPPFEDSSPFLTGDDHDALPSDPQTRWDAALALSVAQEPPKFDPATDFEYSDVLALLKDSNSSCRRIARQHLAGEVEIEQLLEAVSHAQWRDPRFAEKYRERVAQALKEVREDMEREEVLA